jgi:hypothetical protein
MNGDFMELKLARTELSAKPKSIKLEKIEAQLEADQESILYFDKENSHKDLVALVEHFEEKEYSVYLKEVSFGLADDEYLYEMHIL